MKIAIIGSRTFNEKEKLFTELDSFCKEKEVDLVISGGAKGADSFAQEWAESRKVKTQIFLPDWKAHGRAAGPIRNKLIIESCDFCIAFWDGDSKGTLHSINLAKNQKKPIKIVRN